MEKLAGSIFSMRMMVTGLIVFLVAIATATFLESNHDIQAAKILVYNALWFEILLAYLGLNLIANIFRYQMWKPEKIAMLTFHLSFLVILIGAAVTRFVSYEGLMLIREKAQTNFIYSSDPQLWLKVNDGKLQYTYNEQMYMSEISSNNFSIDIDFPDHKSPISVEYVNFRKKLVDSLVVNDSINGLALEIITDGMTSNYLSKGDFVMAGDLAISFEKENAMPGVELFQEGNKILMRTQLPMRYLPMAEMQKARQSGADVSDSLYHEVPMDTLVPFQTTTLYQAGSQQFVFKQILKNAQKMKLPSGKRNVGSDYLTVKITDGDKSTIVDLEGGQGAIPEHVVFEFNGLTYEMEYGSMRIPLPFAIECRDFQLDKYPGSSVASSFASEVTIIDEKNNFRKDQRIFMNNVMDYGGYRFFQSSYDPDEGGTRLSVSHDWWGTNITYLGYLLMTIGMIMSLFASNGRFRDLTNKLKKSRERREKLLSIFIGILLLSNVGFSQEHSEHDGHDHSTEERKSVFQIMSIEHSEDVASLMVQDFQGRIIPMHTLCDQLLRKVYRSNTYKSDEIEELNAVQAIMSMHMYPDFWSKQAIIYVSSKSNLREKLKMKGSLISYRDLTDEEGQFKLIEDYSKAHQTLESKRGEYEKQLIKLGEKYQVAQSIFSWSYMKIIPVAEDPNNTWFVPLNMELLKKDSLSSSLALEYLSSLDKAAKEGQYGVASDNLATLKKFQRKIAKGIAPSEDTITKEISYNKMSVFKNSYRSYLLIGLIMLILFFINIFITPSKKSNKMVGMISKIMTVLAIIVFAYHGYGIYLRAIITGHAPWSNGYEAVVFIAWITMLTGLIFSRKNAVILAGTAILAALMIFVTEMNLMDPEITPLQPVLKSYWLMIHVAVITGSYGPLGISCILGVLNLLLYIFRTKKNGQIVTMNINELTYVSEMTMTIGLFMLTIGTFLGGIWANESWGRYWGWDPKETWALVAVLVYAVILHLRYIPGLKSKFLFNTVALWGYTSILFTFFGVNFYLVGLHSYAQGEGVAKIPNGLIISVVLFGLFTIIAVLRNKQYSTAVKNELLD